jgi:uncharacterized protein (TIGR03435 family)
MRLDERYRNGLIAVARARIFRNVATVLVTLLVAVALGAHAQSSRPQFEVASVKPNTVPHTGPLWNGACAGGTPQVEPRRFAATTTVYSIVSWAYGLDCYVSESQNRILTNAAWIRKDLFTIEAVIPAGSPAYTGQQLQNGEAADLQKMIEDLLTDRFKLQLHRENREIPIYALTAGNKPRLKRYEEGSCDPVPLNGQRSTPHVDQKPPCDFGVELMPGVAGRRTVTANGVTLDKFAQLLSLDVDRPVINRTGFNGQFDFRLEYALISAARVPTGAVDAAGPSVFTAIQEQLGLKLESSKGAVEDLVIDSVTRPTEN